MSTTTFTYIIYSNHLKEQSVKTQLFSKRELFKKSESTTVKHCLENTL